MKNAKKIAVFFTVLFCLTAAIFAFTACTENGNDLEKTVTIVIGEGENSTVYADFTTSARYLSDALNELSNDVDNPLTIGGTWGSFGLFLTQIGDLTAEGNAYISVLTSDTEYADVTEWAVSKQYGDTEVVTATLGVSSLPLKDGQVYMFVLLNY